MADKLKENYDYILEVTSLNSLLKMDQIYGYYRILSDTIWSEDIWLPPNTTWADVNPNNGNGIRYTDYRHLIYPIPMAFAMLVIRYVVERYWFSPMGRLAGIKNSRNKKAKPNDILEKAYLEMKHPNHHQILILAKKVDMTERQVSSSPI